MAEIPERTRFQAVVVTDLRTRKETYKIYRRGMMGRGLPLVSGLASRELAEARIRELEAEADSAAKKESLS